MKILSTTDNHYGFTHKTHNILEKFYTDLYQLGKKEGINVLVNAGDWAITKQKQLKNHFELIRKCCPDFIIIGVLGNHDFWTRDHNGSSPYNPVLTYEELVKHQKTWAEKFDIRLLDADWVAIEDVIFCGFDGWYGHYNPPTNDRSQMFFKSNDPEPFKTLHKKATTDFEKILDVDINEYRKSVLLTHFPWFTENQLYKDFCANSQMEPFILEKFDIAIVGHSHQRVDGQLFKNNDNECLVYNAGSDYNQPKYQIIEI